MYNKNSLLEESKQNAPEPVPENMIREVYKVRTPESLEYGNPQYLTQKGVMEPEEQIVRIIPPKGIAARVMLSEFLAVDDFLVSKPYKVRSMSIYLAPNAHMNTYLRGMQYKDQTWYNRELCVDSKEFYLSVGNTASQVSANGDGYFAMLRELGRPVGGKRIVDAMVLSMYFLEDVPMDSLRQWTNHFFQDVQIIEDPALQARLEMQRECGGGIAQKEMSMEM